MSKQARMQKRIVFELIVAGVLVAGAVGIMIGTGAWFSATDTKRNTLRSEVGTLDAKLNEITGQISESTNSQAIYDEIVQQKSNLDFVVVREDGLKRIGAMREKYRLSSLNLSMAPEVKLEFPKLQNLNAKVVQIDVELKFGAMSDVHIFSFVDELRRTMPGFVRLESLEIARDKAMDVGIYQQMSKGALPQMVSGNLMFKWIGLMPPEAAESATGDPAAGATGEAAAPMVTPMEGVMP